MDRSIGDKSKVRITFERLNIEFKEKFRHIHHKFYNMKFFLSEIAISRNQNIATSIK